MGGGVQLCVGCVRSGCVQSGLSSVVGGCASSAVCVLVLVMVLVSSVMGAVETVGSTRAVEVDIVATYVESATSLHASTATVGGVVEEVRGWEGVLVV